MTRPLYIGGVALAILLLLLAGYAAAGFLLVPQLLASALESRLADDLALDGHVESVAFDPFRLRLVVRGFTMGEPGEPAAASLDELRIDLDATRLLTGHFDFEEVFLAGPLVEVRITEAGGLRVAGIVLVADDPEAAPVNSEAAPTSEAARTGEAGDRGGLAIAELLIRNGEIRDGRLRIVDQSRASPVEQEVGPIDLRVGNLDLTPLLGAHVDHGAGSSAMLTIDLGEGARFAAQGEIAVEPLRLDLNLELSGLGLISLQPWLDSFAQLEVRDGVVGLDGRLRMAGDSDSQSALHFEGSLVASSLRLVAPGGKQPLVAWKSLELTGIDVRSDPLAIGIERIELLGPELRLVRSVEGLNAARVFVADGGDAEEEVASLAAEAAKTDGRARDGRIPISIGPIRIEAGTFVYQDTTLSPPYRLELEELAVSADRVTEDPAGRTALEVSAMVYGYAPVTLKGSLAPLAPDAFTDLRFSAEGVELATFTPFAGRYLGYEVEAGRATAHVELRLDQRNVLGRNELILDNLDFGAAVDSPDATALPVATAAALLANGDGEIRIEMPVEGNLDDPDFSYGGALLDTVRTMVTRVASLPLKLVGGMVELGGKLVAPSELVEVAFAPGSRRLRRDQKAKLELLAKGFERDASLRIEVQGGADPTLDGEADLRSLARRRAGAVRDYLIAEGVSEDAVRIGDIQIEPRVEAESGGQVVTHLELR